MVERIGRERVSKRDQIRDKAEEILRECRTPMHNSKIAELVLPMLGLNALMSAKDVNTCLHDDPANRFIRVEKGTWTLKEFAR
jgi:hypothetical protein